MASMKRYYNPATGQLEYMPGYNDKSKLTVTEKLMADGLKKKPLTNAELGQKPLIKKTAIGNVKYIPKDQRLYEKLKVPGYETPEKSAKSYKHHLQDPVSDKITMDDWRNETPIYRKHLADIIADEQTNIRWDTAGGWRDKWGDPKTGSDALKEQQEIQKTYDGIFPQSMQKKYEESKKQKRIGNHLKQVWGLNKKTPPKIISTPIGNIKNLDKTEDSPYSDKAIERDVMQRERLGKPMSGNDAVIREIIRDKAVEKLKSMPAPAPVEIFQDLNEMAEMKMQDQINTKKFEDIMKSKKDPDADKGIASVPGVEKFKKVADAYNDYQKTIPRGVGTIIGEFD